MIKRFDLYIIRPEINLIDNWKYYLLLYEDGELYSYEFFDEFSALDTDFEHQDSFEIGKDHLKYHNLLKSYKSIKEIIEDYAERFI